MDLATPVGNIATIGPAFRSRLENLEIYTVGDLLFHVPFRYEDFSIISTISALQEGETVTIQGKIATIKNEFTRSRRFIQRAQVQDDSATIDIIWFNQTYLTRLLPVGTMVSISGKVETYQKNFAFISPAFEIINPLAETIHTGRLVPIYPETRGISSKWLRTKEKQLLALVATEVKEYLPQDILNANDLMPLPTAIKEVHFPKNLPLAEKARRRLAFDEFLMMHLVSAFRKKQWEEKRVGHSLSIAKYKNEIAAFWGKLPFTLTNAQKQAVKDIFADLAGKKPMNRLLEGDVGSGKTVVAAIGMYITFLNGYQSILMAPTQILAEQHFATISNLLSPLGVSVGLVTGSSKYHVSSIKNNEPKKIPDTKYIIHNTNILIGTHALLSESVKLDKLGFIVIDEQHRFGVEQRGLLLKKGDKEVIPHVLTMTATPIPRTVALTMYGNLDLSYLDEMPKGRTVVKTWVVAPHKREAAYGWIAEKIAHEGAQVFIICPFIEESETQTTVKAASKEFEMVKTIVFPKQKVGLLHGKMKAKEKTSVMDDFKNRKLDILVATPVVEVGIDVPGATIIIIEGSERFGLAQLHQLRGRVGRSNIQSYCLLFTQSQSPQTLTRLAKLEKIHVGAVLAELDLHLRGPGEIHGVRQHGSTKLKIAHFSDSVLIEKTKEAANQLLKREESIKNASLLQQMLKTYTIRIVEPN